MGWYSKLKRGLKVDRCSWTEIAHEPGGVADVTSRRKTQAHSPVAVAVAVASSSTRPTQLMPFSDLGSTALVEQRFLRSNHRQPRFTEICK